VVAWHVAERAIDLLQQVQSAVGQALDARDIWIQESGANESHPPARKKQSKQRALQLQTYHERLERLRPLLAQASASLLRGIIIQSRTVPSMVAYVAGEALPFDAEEDTDPQDVIEGI
jgi:ATP-dependent RNA helicase HelY